MPLPPAVQADPLSARNELDMIDFLATWAAQDARRTFLEFLRYVWWQPEPLRIGRHTRAMAEAIDQAIDRFEAGQSSFTVVQVPFRHGKSDIFSRALPAYALGKLQAHQIDVIMSGYGADLVEGFSRKAQSIISDPRYQRVFPGVVLREKGKSAASWGVEGSAGEVTVVGLGGAVTGKGGHLIVLDDYCKSREEAESEAYREQAWGAFRDSLMTRRAPRCMVFVVATPWHEDDVIGRIRSEMAVNADFPRFEFLTFPATDPETGERLFPERMTEAWYKEQYATLGPYSAAALLDCNPRPKSEQRFMREWFRYYPMPGLMELPAGLAIDLIVDYAGSTKSEACESVILERAVGGEEMIEAAKGRFLFDRLTHGRMGADLLRRTIRDRVQARRSEGRRVRLGLEQGAGIVLKAWLEDDFKRNGLTCEIYEVKSPAGTGAGKPGDAKLRIEALIAPFAAGLILHNRSIGSEQVWNGGEFVATSICGGELERQLIGYPSKPDDCADCAAYSLQKVELPTGKREKPQVWAGMLAEERFAEHEKRMAKRGIKGRA